MIAFDEFATANRKARALRESAWDSLRLMAEIGNGATPDDELSIALASLCAARALRCLEDARKMETGDAV